VAVPFFFFFLPLLCSTECFLLGGLILSCSDLKTAAISKPAAVLVVVFSKYVCVPLSFLFYFQVDHFFRSVKAYSELALALGERKAMAACFTFKMLLFGVFLITKFQMTP